MALEILSFFFLAAGKKIPRPFFFSSSLGAHFECSPGDLRLFRRVSTVNICALLACCNGSHAHLLRMTLFASRYPHCKMNGCRSKFLFALLHRLPSASFAPFLPCFVSFHATVPLPTFGTHSRITTTLLLSTVHLLRVKKKRRRPGDEKEPRLVPIARITPVSLLSLGFSS